MAPKNILKKARAGFTIVEIIVVVAIISILAIVVILTINPAALLQQSRDAARIASIGTITKAVSLYYSDAISNPSTLFMGTSSVIYVSLPDPLATPTAGDQCQGLGLPALPTGYTYQCAESSTYQNTNGTGWIPINFNNYSAGSVIPSLPFDPLTSTSTNLYFNYQTDGIGGFVTSAFLESQKDAPLMPADGGNNPEVYEKGTNLNLPTGRGLIGYWPLDEGSGSTTADISGNNATGTWHNAATGTSGYYSPGKVWPWAGTFDGSSTYVSIPDNTSLDNTGDMTAAFWAYAKSYPSYPTGTTLLEKYSGNNINFAFSIVLGYQEFFRWTNSANGAFCTAEVTPISTYAPINTWFYLVGVRRGATCELWFDGTKVSTAVASGTPPALVGAITYIGGDSTAQHSLNGYMDDVRIYNRALLPAEIQEMYYAEK